MRTSVPRIIDRTRGFTYDCRAMLWAKSERADRAVGIDRRRSGLHKRCSPNHEGLISAIRICVGSWMQLAAAPAGCSLGLVHKSRIFAATIGLLGFFQQAARMVSANLPALYICTLKRCTFNQGQTQRRNCKALSACEAHGNCSMYELRHNEISAHSVTRRIPFEVRANMKCATTRSSPVTRNGRVHGVIVPSRSCSDARLPEHVHQAKQC